MPAKKRPRNLKTQKAHQRQVWLQIILPLSIGGLLSLALAVWIATASEKSQGLHTAADASLLLLLLPWMLLALVTIAALGALIYGIGYLLHWLPPQFFLLHTLLNHLYATIQNSADALVEPILRIRSLGAAYQALGQALRRARPERKDTSL